MVKPVTFHNGKVDLEMNKGSKYCPDCHKPFCAIQPGNVSGDYIFEEAYCEHCNEFYDITYARIWESTKKV